MTQNFYDKVQSLRGEHDILCIGELLTDYIAKDNKPLKESEVFDKFFGGSPANIVYHMTHLGKKALLITKIGDDDDGKFLLNVMEKYNLVREHVQISKSTKTTKSIVAPSIETPEFEIIRGADTLLMEDEIDFSLIKKTKIVHTNAFTLAEEPTRSTVLKVLNEARKAKKLISFDPNYRKSVWKGSDAKSVLSNVYKYVDLTKPSMDDAKELFGDMKPKEYIKAYHKLGAKIVVLTMGSKGSLISDGKEIKKIMPEHCEAKDATGAGDLYWSVFLTAILDGSTLESAGRKASYGATRVVAQNGAIISQEEHNEIQAYMKLY